jgi:soluble lytic murein transglycosylase-like protein
MYPLKSCLNALVASRRRRSRSRRSCLIAAQAYQESRLNQKLKSPAGAVGVMQIKPTTAADPHVRIADVQRPAA